MGSVMLVLSLPCYVVVVVVDRRIAVNVLRSVCSIMCGDVGDSSCDVAGDVVGVVAMMALRFSLRWLWMVMTFSSVLLLFVSLVLSMLCVFC